MIQKEENNFDISVAMIAYYHGKFIAIAIESILRQKFGGKLEIIIGVDKCDDNTLSVCKEFSRRYPFISLIEHPINVGMFTNFFQTLQKCRGKYIALLEGDDYWENENKLTMQFLYMEKYGNCIVTSGQIKNVDEGGRVISTKGLRQIFKGKYFYKEDISFSNKLATLTVMLRRSCINWKEFEKLNNSPHLDWSFYVSLQYEKESFIYRFNKLLGAYRHHTGGVYSLVGEEKRSVNILKTIASITTLSLQPWQIEYYRNLYSNYFGRLKNKEQISGQLFHSSLFVPEKMLFNNGKISHNKIGLLNRLALASFFSNMRKRVEFFILFELFRQSKPSGYYYFNVFIFPFIFVGIVQKLVIALNPGLFHSKFIKYTQQ
jgi:glycosyltransferase involved in cell wall biosynthesis